MNWTKAGHGALIFFGCVGAAAGALAVSLPQYAQTEGAVAAACIAVVGVLGRYLPSASDAVNLSAASKAVVK